MEKRTAVAKTLDNISEAVPHPIRLPDLKAWIDYDEDADVLYISLKRPQKATDTTDIPLWGNFHISRILEASQCGEFRLFDVYVASKHPRRSHRPSPYRANGEGCLCLIKPNTITNHDHGSFPNLTLNF
jgi:hypothetical protein